MEKLKKLLILKKPIACFAILGSALLATVMLAVTLLFGAFSSITTISVIDAVRMIFDTFDGVSWISLLEFAFGAGTIFVLFVSIKHILVAIKNIKLFIRSFKAESDYGAHALVMRENLLMQCCLFALYCICGYALCGFEFSGWALACTIIMIVCFTISTTALMFFEDTLPSVTFISIETVRYALVPTLCALLFRFVCQPGIVRSTGYKITSFFSGIDNLGDDVEGTVVAQMIYNVFVEPVLLIVAVVFITILLLSVFNSLTPDRTALPDESKPPVYRFKKLGIFLTSCLVLRTVCALFLNENGVDFEPEEFIKTTFNLSRNDLLPAILIAFAGFFLIKIIYSHNESFLSAQKNDDATLPADNSAPEATKAPASAPQQQTPASNESSAPVPAPESASTPVAPVQEKAPSASDTMFCRFCGAKIVSGSAFCAFCGQKLN